MKFEWDVLKARNNLQKHGVAFDRALFVFSDPLAATKPDERNPERWITLGEVEGQLLVVVHADVEIDDGEQEVRIRLISARRATKHEAADYRG